MWAAEIGHASGWQESRFPIARRDVEDAFGLTLPEDYFELAARFGEGAFGGGVYVLSGLPSRSDSLVEMWRVLDRVAESSGLSADRHYAPYKLFQRGDSGLLPWGGTDRGDIYFWLADSQCDPGTWPIVAQAAEGVDDTLPNRFAQFDMSASKFLWHILYDGAFGPLGVANIGPLRFVPDTFDESIG